MTDHVRVEGPAAPSRQQRTPHRGWQLLWPPTLYWWLRGGVRYWQLRWQDWEGLDACPQECPFCGWQGWDPATDDWFVQTACGRNFNGESYEYWCEGSQQCARCRHRVEVYIT